MSTRTGTATLPLHAGRAPRWLFDRMTRLARAIALMMTEEFGPGELLARLADPYWFQAFGCTLGFDWHSSGVTTTVCAALKEGLRGAEEAAGLYVAGGKGRASRRTPDELREIGERVGVDPEPLIRASRLSAKVDSAAVQDGYQVYHHAFVFSPASGWAVVQQGMNAATRRARRYHWLGAQTRSFVRDPHAAICCDVRGPALNLVAGETDGVRDRSAALARQRPDAVLREIGRLRDLAMPDRHALDRSDINPARLRTVLLRTYERQPGGFEALLGTEGVGAATLRALALVSELLYGEQVSRDDPARYAFAHGGKDGTPFPVDRAIYDGTIAVLDRAVRASKIGRRDQLEALRRLHSAFGDPG